VRGDIPQYPPLALQARVSGTIKFKVTIKGGDVIRVESPKVSGAITMLSQAATENVKTWKFATQSLETFEVTYDYQFSKDEVDEPQNPKIEMLLPVYVRIVADPIKPRTVY
jgi:outer membrane biosynthesis protein TonB